MTGLVPVAISLPGWAADMAGQGAKTVWCGLPEGFGSRVGRNAGSGYAQESGTVGECAPRIATIATLYRCGSRTAQTTAGALQVPA